MDKAKPVQRGADHGILREQEAGMKVAEVCHKHGISEPTFYLGCQAVEAT